MKRQWIAILITFALLVSGVFILLSDPDNGAASDNGSIIAKAPPVGNHLLGYYGHSIDLTPDGGFVIAGYVKYHSREHRDHDVWILKVDKSGEEDWSRTFGGASTDRAWAVRSIPQGRFLILGESHSYGNDYQTLVIKLDEDGKEEWSKTMGGAGTDRGRGIHLLSDGRALLTGTAGTDSTNLEQFWLCEITDDGKIIQQQAFEHELPGGATSITQLKSGDLILLGELQDPETRSIDLGLLRVDGDGQIVGTKRLGSDRSDGARSVVAHPDGGYLVSGTEHKDDTNKSDVVVYKFDASDELVWKTYSGGKGQDVGEHLILTQDGGSAVIATTRSFGAGYTDVYITKLSDGGEIQWTQTFGGPKTDWGYDLKQQDDGSYILSCGSKSTGGNATDIWVIKLNPNGSKAWDKVYGIED